MNDPEFLEARKAGLRLMKLNSSTKPRRSYSSGCIAVLINGKSTALYPQ